MLISKAAEYVLMRSRVSLLGHTIGISISRAMMSLLMV